MLIRVWCNCNFEGDFGKGFEDVFSVKEGLTEDQIDALIAVYLKEQIGFENIGSLTDSFEWEEIEPVELA